MGRVTQVNLRPLMQILASCGRNGTDGSCGLTMAVMAGMASAV